MLARAQLLECSNLSHVVHSMFERLVENVIATSSLPLFCHTPLAAAVRPRFVAAQVHQMEFVCSLPFLTLRPYFTSRSLHGFRVTVWVVAIRID